MYKLNGFLELIDGYIGSSQWFALALLGVGLFFTLYLRFPQIRYFRHALRIVKGKYDKSGDEGDTTHFQALATALSGTVGTGNIAGVAFAIHLGGPAALFWMLATAMVGMTTKFVEVTLSHKYREKTGDNSMAGGPMYYMKNAKFSMFHKKVNLKWLAVIFAIATVISSLGTGNMPQVKSIADSINTSFGLPHILTGSILAFILGLVIVGGIKRIASVTSRLVPIMAIFYFLGAFAVIIYNYHNIIPSFISIFSDIFTGTAASGGFLGAGIAFAFNRGVNRGLFSNEAGQGSAPIAHAAARAHEPVSEGMVAILEPFVDTIIICFLTGLVLLSSGAWKEKIKNTFEVTDTQFIEGSYSDNNSGSKEALFNHIAGKKTLKLFTGDLEIKNGKITNEVTCINSRSVAENIEVDRNGLLFNGKISVFNGKVNLPASTYISGYSLIHSAPLTTEAFTKSFLGRWGKYIVSIGILLFAFSTAISWSYYGDRAITFLLGNSYVIYFRIFYVISFLVASFLDTKLIWTFSGITIALMTLPNLIGIFWLRKEVKSTINQYWEDFKTEYPDEKIPEK